MVPPGATRWWGSYPRGQAPQIVASKKTTFSWSRPFDAEYVRGELAAVSTYVTNDSETLVAAASLTDITVPTTGAGRY